MIILALIIIGIIFFVIVFTRSEKKSINKHKKNQKYKSKKERD